MKHDAKKYLVDIALSIDIILKYADQIQVYTDFANDQKSIDAIERRLAIIGEALNKAMALDNSIIVNNSKKIIGLRHILVHDYDLVDAPIIWKIVKNDIPVLKKEIEAILP